MKKKVLIELIPLLIIGIYVFSYFLFLWTSGRNSFASTEKQSRVVLFSKKSTSIHSFFRFLYYPLIKMTKEKYWILNKEEHIGMSKNWTVAPEVIEQTKPNPSATKDTSDLSEDGSGKKD